jgi:plastocyanin
MRTSWKSRGAVLGLALALLAGCLGGSATQANTVPEPVQIVIDNFAYQPKEVTVAVGTKVVWVNRDDVPHTATSTAKPKAFDSGSLDTNQKFEHTFDKPGVYEYYCAVHPKMTGKVIVK